MKYNAIIIAAGTSSRFVPLSYERPKGLIEVKGEVLIERQIRQLHEGGIYDITIVVGYMANLFTYLSKKYNVSIVKNEDYYCYNNTSSLIRVLNKLHNTYICCSDQYYENNPFLTQPQESAYAVLYAKGTTNEYCIKINDRNQIQNVSIGGKDCWYMAGFSFFNSEFSDKFKAQPSRAVPEILFSTEKSVACVAKTWENISVLVELTVKCRDVNGNVGVLGGNLCNALRRADYRHKLYLLAAPALERRDSVTSRAARCEHWIDDKYRFILYSFG
jgi:CTP:phosphocholine cytidylyltransferase-like protein